jgi:hypothetical protein
MFTKLSPVGEDSGPRSRQNAGRGIFKGWRSVTGVICCPTGAPVAAALSGSARTGRVLDYLQLPSYRRALVVCGDLPARTMGETRLFAGPPRRIITLRARHPGVTKALATLPASAWTSMTLGRAGGRTRRVKVHDDPAAALSAYPRPLRQLAVTGLGHDQPTLLITNGSAAPARKIIESYARRMNIEQRLAEAIQSFSLDALAGAVPPQRRP